MNTMTKTNWMLAVVAGLLSASQAQAAVIYSESFDAFADGDLVGQGGWTSATTGLAGNGSITVENGQVKIVPDSSGTAAGSMIVFAPSFGNQSGTTYYGLDVYVTALPTTGQAGPNILAIGSGANRGITRIRQWSNGTQYDLVNNAAANIPLSPVTKHRLVIEHTPGVTTTGTRWWYSSGSLDINDTPYYSSSSGGGNINTIAFFSADETAPDTGMRVSFDNVVVATTFAEVVPEPATLALLGLGASLMLTRQSRRYGKV